MLNYGKYGHIFAKIAVICSIGLVLTSFSAQAGQLSDGAAFFDKAPSLVNVSATKIDVWALGAKYYFTITIPEDADAPLGKVTITQRRGAENIRYETDLTFAFVGSPGNQGENLRVETASETDGTALITVNFTRPVPPGTTLTIGLVPKINPGFGDTYIFGVTAFPVGKDSQGIYLGVGRISFHQQGPLRFPGR
jgi:hypothetical protein